MKTSWFRYGLMVSIFAGASLACNLLSGINQANQARETVQSIASQARGFITENADLISTAQTFATQEGGSFMETARAFATEEGPGLLETAKAFATNDAPQMLETAKALATEHPELMETAQAFATQGLPSGEAPADIPIIDGDQASDYFASENVVSYSTAVDFQAVVEFYKDEMPANGWERTTEGSDESGSPVLMMFSKPDRTASVVITESPIENKTIVLVTILPRQ